jgi:hypothetical protein
MQTLTCEEVQEKYPAAWNALPEIHKADSSLTFYLVHDGLCASSLKGEFNWEEAEDIWFWYPY